MSQSALTTSFVSKQGLWTCLCLAEPTRTMEGAVSIVTHKMIIVKGSFHVVDVIPWVSDW